jgi:N-carbamoyl-L-amino-acid hydrolase
MGCSLRKVYPITRLFVVLKGRVGVLMAELSLRMDASRLFDRLTVLSQIGAMDVGGVTRLALTDEDKQARDLLVVWMQELGLEVRVDEVGNIFGIRQGNSKVLPVMLGSHIDTVIGAGRLDGCYGVLAALECIRVLNENNIETNGPVVVAAFTNEEGVRYQPGMLGSSAHTGILQVKKAYEIIGIDGTQFGKELERIGYAGTMRCGEIRPLVYLELHIEQGPVLDRERIPLGVVEGVVGISWWEVTITGTANHAGTTPIELRHDAGLSAAKMITHVRNIAVSIGGNQRATCGMVRFYPNAINVIPGKSTFTVDLRNDDEEELEKAERLLEEYSRIAAQEDGVTVDLKRLEKVPAVHFDEKVVSVLEKTADTLGIRFRRMVSGAGHDAQLMAGICPAAMIFVPSLDGISHSPRESTPPESLALGATVLLHALLTILDISYL